MDDYDEYNCGCECDLKECDNACCTYFVLQDARPYRNVDMSSYDRFTTLIAKPGSLKLDQTTSVGWWRMN